MWIKSRMRELDEAQFLAMGSKAEQRCARLRLRLLLLAVLCFRALLRGGACKMRGVVQGHGAHANLGSLERCIHVCDDDDQNVCVCLAQ